MVSPDALWDGHIGLLTRCCSEFRTFVEETEKELLSLFRSIDYNDDGKLSKSELRSAFSRAGLSVPNSNLDNFFAEVDTNNDGAISFEEWRYVPSLRNSDRLWRFCFEHAQLRMILRQVCIELSLHGLNESPMIVMTILMNEGTFFFSSRPTPRISRPLCHTFPRR